MKAIVFGGSGYIGSNIVKLLGADEISYYSRHRSDELEKLGIEWIEGDILDSEKVEEAIKPFDLIIDAVGIHDESEQKYFDVNVNGVKNIVSAIQKNKQNQRLIYISSINVHYGMSDFFRTKGIAEDNVALLKNFLNVRPSVVFGRGDRFTKDLVKLSERSISKIPDGGSLSPVFIDDLVEVIKRSSDINGAIDVCSNDMLKFVDMYNIVAKKLGTKPASLVAKRMDKIVDSIAEQSVFSKEQIERYLLNYSRGNTSLYRFVKEPMTYEQYVSESL